MAATDVVAGSLYLRVAGVWYAADGRRLAPAGSDEFPVVFRRSGPPPAKPAAGRPPTTNGDAMTMPTISLETLKNLAQNVAPTAAAELLNLVGAGLRAKYNNAGPTMEADLSATFGDLQAAYAAGKVAEAAVVKFLADLKATAPATA